MKNEKKIGRYVFIALLSINGLIALGFGVTALFNFPYALETGFNIPYSSELDMLGIVMGMELLFLTGIGILSIFWISKGKIAGTVTGIATGSYLFIFGPVAFIKTGDPQALYVDSIRGILTIIFGIMAYQELKKRGVNG